MSEMGRRVVAYHPEICVRRGEGMVVIQVDMDDWYEEDEVLGKLSAANPDCGTFGDLVLAIEGRNGELSPGQFGVVSCRISGGSADFGAAQSSVRNWDDPI